MLVSRLSRRDVIRGDDQFYPSYFFDLLGAELWKFSLPHTVSSIHYLDTFFDSDLKKGNVFYWFFRVGLFAVTTRTTMPNNLRLAFVKQVATVESPSE